MNIASRAAALFCAMMILSVTGCSTSESKSPSTVQQSGSPAEVSSSMTDIFDNSEPDSSAEEAVIPVHEHEQKEKPVYDPEASCSIYIYMCGSNLESKNGLAGKDIDELLEADIPEQVNVILETGGAAKWRSHNIANDKLQRYIVKDHALTLIEELEDHNMGDMNTFVDFLNWGRSKYPAERNMLIVWDHGGNATEGVCYDENHGFEGLKLSEFRFLSEQDDTAEEKYDMVIFDACLMGNIETASWMQDYFHYMIASEAIVPGGGLDYKVIAEEFPKNDDESYGKLICDSFMEQCKAKGKENTSELSLLDLSKTDGVLNELEKLYADNVAHLDKSDDALIESEASDAFLYSVLAEFRTTVENGKNYNVVDIYYYAKSTDWGSEDNIEGLKSALNEMVIYQVGKVSVRPFPDFDPEYYVDLCSGISMYFPMKFDKSETADYISICPVKKYAELLDKLYMQLPEVPLEFVNSGSLSADGQIEIELTEDSRKYLKEVSEKVWKMREKDKTFIILGTHTILGSDISSMKITSPFSGEWYYLGGQLMNTTVEQNGNNTKLISQIELNGDYTTYIANFTLGEDGKPVFEKGVTGMPFDENGLVNREAVFEPLKKGDKVCMTSKDIYEVIEPFTVESDDITVEMKKLEPGTYRVQLIAVDINNNYISSDYAVYSVTKDGVQPLEVTKAE